METKNTRKVFIYLVSSLVIVGLAVGLAFSKNIAFFGKTAVTSTTQNCNYAFTLWPQSLTVAAGKSYPAVISIKGDPPSADISCANDPVQIQLWDTPAQKEWEWCSVLTKTIAGSNTTTMTCSPPANISSSYDLLLRILRGSEVLNTATVKFEFEKTPCTAFYLTLDKSEYGTQDTVQLTYSCAEPSSTAVAEKLLLEINKPDGTTWNGPVLSNATSGSQSIPLSQFSGLTGNFLLRSCIGGACGVNNTNSTSFTVKETAAPKACKNGERCSSTSWCESGTAFYYPNGDITCVAWTTGSASMDELVAPEGTSDCGPSDTSCINRGTIVPYSSSKWCRYGRVYYSKDGTKMTCGKHLGGAPAGYTPCWPDAQGCIPSGSYGPKSGWCPDGVKFYQKTTDTNPDNDTYCAAYLPSSTLAPTPLAYSMTMEQPTPPAGYSVCDPDDKNCKQKGESWTQTDNSIYCMNGQKCANPAGGGSCVSWSEECPQGTKYCTSDNEYCMEPNEYKNIPATSTAGGYWCGGSSGGMVFYSTGKVYCAAKKTKPVSGTSWVWTADEIKQVLAELGSGWGLCRSGESNCIEPGKTGPSSGWCAWWPPSQTYTPVTYPTYSSADTTRTCPSLDGETVVEKKEEPKKEEPKKEEPKKEEPKICTQVLSQAYNPKTNECKTYPTPCDVPADWIKGTPPSGKCGVIEEKKEEPKKEEKKTCPVVPTPACPSGYKLATTVDANGCSMPYCATVTQTGLPPYMPPSVTPGMPTPTVPPGMPVEPMPPQPIMFKGDCKMLREQARMFKYEIRDFEQMLKHLPKKVEVPANMRDLISKAKSQQESLQNIQDEKTCMEELNTRTNLSILENTMNELRNASMDIELYRRCSEFQQRMVDRAKMLKEEAKRLRDSNTNFSEEITGLNKLAEKAKSACAAKNKENLRETLEDLEFDTRDIEDQINDKYQEMSNMKRDSFVEDTIKNIYAGITMFRERIEAEDAASKPECAKIPGMLDEMENLADEASKQYKNGNIEDAAMILDKIERFKDPMQEGLSQCGLMAMSNFTAMPKAVIYTGMQGVDEAAINRIVDTVVDKFTSKFQAMLDEKIAALTAQVSKLTDALQTKLTESINALQAIPKEKREIVQETKSEFVETIDAVKTAAPKLTLANSTRLNAALEKAVKINWCGAYAEDLKKQAEAMQLKAKEQDITNEDIAFFESAIAAYDAKNNEECYRTGVTRFRDVAPHVWYYPYIQTGVFFKGTSDASGNLTGNVEPGRSLVRAEALIAIERAINAEGIEGNCALEAKANGVPAWANCAVNYGANAGIQFTAKMDEAISRDELAKWIPILAKNNLPVMASGKYTQDFTDIGLCKDNEGAVAAMVANKIMTGVGGEGPRKWGCGQPLVRAELAAILSRLADLASIVK